MNFICRICSSNANHTSYRCQEKMFGWGDEFQYFQCGNCGCLQIAAIPTDLGRFYPPNYYSFHAEPFPQSGWKSRLAAMRDFSAATGTGILGKLLNKITPARSDVASLIHVPTRKDLHILDVGCGRGQLLSVLHRAGFGHLLGVDPFLSEDIEILPGLYVRKQSLEQIQERFDLIMLHHVFEHIESGRQTLQTCRERLTPHGKIPLRFPTPESDAWERYRENWVQIDAPRHLFLHTHTSLQLLAEQSDLKIEKWVCDSSAFQFWGSELYRKGLSLCNENGIITNPEDHFTKMEMQVFDDKSRLANTTQRGDQIFTILSDRSI